MLASWQVFSAEAITFTIAPCENTLYDVIHQSIYQRATHWVNVCFQYRLISSNPHQHIRLVTKFSTYACRCTRYLFIMMKTISAYHYPGAFCERIKAPPSFSHLHRQHAALLCSYWGSCISTILISIGRCRPTVYSATDRRKLFLVKQSRH